MNEIKDFIPACPIPISDYPRVLLAHGGGGRLMHQLIAKIFKAGFGDLSLQAEHDAAVLSVDAGRLAFTTDSFVVNPLRFPGGDIGSLAVYGTVNDLATSGARPYCLSVGFILEEGLAMDDLWQIVQSMRRAAQRAGVRIVTGDTKVVDKGKGDGLFINTAGIGIIDHDLTIAPAAIRPGDAIIINGDLGRHGIAIMAVREGLSFETEIESDAAPLNELVLSLLDAGIHPHCIRDLTRGGLASSLNEITTSTNLGIQIEKNLIPVREDVRGACEILGFDPLYVANEGRMVLFVPPEHSEGTLAILKKHTDGKEASVIGRVTEEHPGIVKLTSSIGVPRILDMLGGEQLPRIC